jgi:hypothetical protein
MSRRPAGKANGVGQPRPLQNPGDDLGLIQDMRRATKWPPKRSSGVKSATATAYLVAPAFGGDAGERPISGRRALKSAAVLLLDSNGVPTAAPVSGIAYTIAVKIVNLGATASYAGLADFYIAAPGAIDAAARGGPRPPAFARIGFSVRSQDMISVASPRTWTPGSELEAQSSLLVHLQDFIFDPLGALFDARANRHVARHDFVPDFSGTWQGVLRTRKTAIQRSGSTSVRIAITQTGLDANCAFFFRGEDGLWPTTPQSEGRGTIAGTLLDFAAVAVPFQLSIVHENWTLTLADPDKLHAERRLSIMLPGIEPLKGDLIRV